MADVLVLTIPTPSFAGDDGRERVRYASANAISDHGSTHGRKSPEYLALFRAVREAARAEMRRVGWDTWGRLCEVQVVRYCPTERDGDAGNLGKVELDALEPSSPKQGARDRSEPFAGVYDDDRLAQPVHLDVEHDPDGPDRLVIIVRRRFAPALGRADAPKRAARAKAKPRAEKVTPAGKRYDIGDGEVLTWEQLRTRIGR